MMKINESRCGLILSELEGACYASSEYLLCGMPVVSTWSHGGRDIWYTSYNSVICDATPEQVAASVQRIIHKKRDPQKIRAMHIAQSEQMRWEFCRLVKEILWKEGLEVDAWRYFKDHYYHKMITCHRPHFDQLFP